jgi:hypothetical protein
MPAEGIRTDNPSKRAAVDPCLRPRDYWYWHWIVISRWKWTHRLGKAPNLFNRNYCISYLRTKMCQFTCTEQEAPDSSRVHRPLVNCCCLVSKFFSCHPSGAWNLKVPISYICRKCVTPVFSLSFTVWWVSVTTRFSRSCWIYCCLIVFFLFLYYVEFCSVHVQSNSIRVCLLYKTTIFLGIICISKHVYEDRYLSLSR